MSAGIYKVLIADDEYWTREKIRNMVNWEKYSLEFLEPAVDGEDALAKIEMNMPDIFITDINMPFINGVELLSTIQKKYPQLITFVISGYDDFNYAKHTFLSGSINYLLKPVAKIDLVNALSKALTIISERKQAKIKEESEELQLRKAASLIQDHEFSQLFEKDEKSLTPNITMNNNMDFAGLSLMLIKIHNMSGLSKQNQHDRNLLSYSIKKQIRDIIQCQDVIVFNHIYRSNEFIVLSQRNNYELKTMAERINLYFTPAINTPVTICISEHSYSMDSIYMAYVQVVSLLMTRKFNDKNVILVCDKRGNDTTFINLLSVEYEKQIKHFLHSQNKGALKKIIFETIGLKYCQKLEWSYLEVRQTVKKILNILNDYVATHMPPNNIVDMENMVDLADKVIESLDGGYLFDVMNDIIEFTFMNQKEVASDSIRGMVKQAVRYIDENYFEELTLSTLALKFNVESSYFSRIFRQETSETLMVYIAKKRVDKAKQYMENEKYNLTEIAFMVGYDDYTYFNKVFRKLVGKSPRDYRSSFTDQEETN